MLVIKKELDWIGSEYMLLTKGRENLVGFEHDLRTT